VRYLLDTNACIAYLTQRSGPIVGRIANTNPGELALCSIVKYELLYGAHKSAKAAENLEKLHRFFSQFRSLPFDDDAAGIAGEVRATLEGQGTPIGPNDLLIAAIALAHGLIIVTRNTSEFGRVPALAFEDWEAVP
jgi:tRNA(fMet)-specific endonuclease VapC